MKRVRWVRTLIIISLASLNIACAAANPYIWKDVKRIIAIGDIHGDYDRLVELLRLTHLIDDSNHWIGGNSHLVQTGDIFDRGPDSKKAMDLLRSLETEAVEAGGGVHALIGNHEAMISCGKLKYAHPGEIEAFGGEDKLLAAMGSDGEYGMWIQSHPAVIQINDILFCHGGLSPAYADKTLEEINKSVREELATGRYDAASILFAEDGPLWYRGYAEKEESLLLPDLTKLLSRHNAKTIVVGHTISKKGIQRRCSGKIIMIDVGLSKTYANGPVQCLMIIGHLFNIINSSDASEAFEIQKISAK